MLFLHILAIVLSLVVGVWMLGIFLGSNLSAREKSVGFGNVLIGAPALALGIWLITLL